MTGALTLTALFALVVVSGAGALDFADEPCPPADPAWNCPSGVVDAPYSIKLDGKTGGGSGPPYAFSLISGSPPTGITLRTDGLISGRPTTAGRSTFWVQMYDSASNPGGQNEFSITIDPRVLVTEQVPGPATVGAAYSLALTAVMKSGPEATSPPSSPVTWTLAGGQLPAGLQLGADGMISGTPTTEGSYGFTVRAALLDGRSDTKALTITVRAPLAITAPGVVPRSEIGVPFRLQLSATGGAGTYAWSLSSGALPSGLVLDPVSGAISGTPRAAGAFAFTATAADPEARTAGYSGRIAVAARLAISTLRLRPGKVGRLYRGKLKTLGGVPPTKWRRIGPPPPRGLQLDRTLGVLSGTPRREGRYRVTFEATDGLKVKAKKTFVIDVLA